MALTATPMGPGWFIFFRQQRKDSGATGDRPEHYVKKDMDQLMRDDQDVTEIIMMLVNKLWDH